MKKNSPTQKPLPHWILGLPENEWGERSIWANKVPGEPQTKVLGPVNQVEAALIARAVNLHSELLSALKHDHETLSIYRKCQLKDSLCSVCKLIAKAEGK